MIITEVSDAVGFMHELNECIHSGSILCFNLSTFNLVAPGRWFGKGYNIKTNNIISKGS